MEVAESYCLVWIQTLLGSKERQRRQWSQHARGRGQFTEKLNGLDAWIVEKIVDVLSEIGTDGGGGDGQTRCPLVDEVLNVGEATVARAGQVVNESLPRRARLYGVGANGPDSGDPGKASVRMPEFGEVMPSARTCLLLDLCPLLESEKGGVPYEQRCVCDLQHGR